MEKHRPVLAASCAVGDVLKAVNESNGRPIAVPAGTAYWPSVGTVVVKPGY